MTGERFEVGLRGRLIPARGAGCSGCGARGVAVPVDGRPLSASSARRSGPGRGAGAGGCRGARTSAGRAGSVGTGAATTRTATGGV